MGCSKKRFCGVCGVVLRLTGKNPQDALGFLGQGGATKERCDGIRQESMFEVRLFGAKQWVAVVEIKKRGAGRLPVFSFSVCRRSCRRHRRRRAPQKRCVNGCQNSRPGGVILPPLPCTSNYNFAFTPVLRSAQAKSLRAPSANCKSPRCFTFHRAAYFRARYYLTAFRLPKRAA